MGDNERLSRTTRICFDNPRCPQAWPQEDLFGPEVAVIPVVLDNLRMPKGQQVPAWLAKHPRFVFPHPPVHCSWRNPVVQWFSILPRQRLVLADFANKAELAERLHAFLREWNQVAHPFKRSTKSVAKIRSKGEPKVVPVLGEPAQAA
jgi:hypothetical protein